MPFSKVSDFEKSFPSIKNMTTEQKAKALTMFNAMMNDGMEESKAIAAAMSKAKMMNEDMMEKEKMMMGERRVFFASEISVDGFEFSDISDDELETKEFQILRTGEFYDRRYGKFSIKETLLNELVTNFNNNAYGQDIAVDINHAEDGKAVAWIKSLSTRNGKLYATLKDFTPEGRKMLKEKAYKYFSVEFAPFETVKNGKKLTIPNVVKGLAITNRPVIKELAATFLSEGNLSFKSSSMETFKKYIGLLLSEAKISKKEFGRLEAMHATLSEDEQAETKPDMEKVEEKVEDTEAADKAAAEKAAADEAAAKAAAGSEEGAKLSELKLAEENKAMAVKLAEQETRIAKLTLSEENREVEKAVSALMLSEKNLIGFAATDENKKALSDFIKKLPADQRVTFSELVKKITVMDAKKLAEVGHSDSGNVDDEKALSEAKDEAVKLAADKKIPLHMALSEVYKKRGMVK